MSLNVSEDIDGVSEDVVRRSVEVDSELADDALHDRAQPSLQVFAVSPSLT